MTEGVAGFPVDKIIVFVYATRIILHCITFVVLQLTPYW